MSQSSSPEDANARQAMKSIRQEIKRILDGWDPLCLKGLKGFDQEYNAYVGPLSVMVRKRTPVGEIAQHLDRLVQDEWKLPPCREKCFLTAEKIYRIGHFLDGGKG